MEKNWDESRLVNEVIKDVLKKLNEISTSSDYEGLVGINSRIEKVKSFLCFEMLDFRVVGIWGMGGIGKTTTAEAIFDQISSQFEGCCFLANVRESEKCGRLVDIRDKGLSKILGESINLSTPNIPLYIKRRLQMKKVLIVLDDVNNSKQIEMLAGGLDRFGRGSRVIITTRDRQLLSNFGVDFIYEADLFKYHEALQLFCKHAFKRDYPPDDFMMFTERVVNYAKGNPLALKVVGSSLHQKSKQDWESALHKLSKIPNPKIHNLLRISYDILDNEEKDIFLDVACFFKGETRDFVTRILNECYFSMQYGLSVLVDKSLVTISFDDRIEIHDLLQEMGWDVVRQESNKQGKRSRLHDHEDVHLVLRRNTGTEAVKGISLDMYYIENMSMCSQVFEKMSHIRFLKFYRRNQCSSVYLPHGLNYLPDELRYLRWDGYPLEVLPSNLSLEYLVELDLSYSKIKQLWEGRKHAPKLKRLILSYSLHLIGIPDLSNSPCLEIINLKCCKSLLDISWSIQHLNNLRHLYLESCKSLTEFSQEVRFESLITLDLSFCSNLTKFPQISGNIKELYLRETAIREVPSSIERLTGLFVLDLSNCTRLEHICSTICKLKSLEDIDLSGTAIKELPSSIIALKKLGRLQLSRCRGLAFPSLSGSLSSLRELLLNNCNLMVIPKDIGCLSLLEKLELRGNHFECLPESMKQLSMLRKLYLNDCNMLQSLKELPSSLEYLEAMNCKQLQSSPDSPEFAELVAERCINGVPYFNWIFLNSPKLNQTALSNILAESLLIIQRRATVAKCKKGTDLGMCYPGSEMPEWFRNQVELPPHSWYNREFLGFALCAVVSFNRGRFDDNSFMTVLQVPFRNQSWKTS